MLYNRVRVLHKDQILGSVSMVVNLWACSIHHVNENTHTFGELLYAYVGDGFLF